MNTKNLEIREIKKLMKSWIEKAQL